MTSQKYPYETSWKSAFYWHMSCTCARAWTHIAHDFCVAHREANSGLSTLNRTKTILSIYHQQRQLQKQRGMCLNDTYPFCQQPLSGNCHSICFSKPVLWTATPRCVFLPFFDSCCGIDSEEDSNAIMSYVENQLRLTEKIPCLFTWISMYQRKCTMEIINDPRLSLSSG